MKQPIKIAVGATGDSWEERFSTALDQRRAQGVPLRYDVVNLHRHDWLAAVMPYDVVLWKPRTMGVEGALHFKEKIYFLEKHVGKLVVPNFSTVWHFESKVAQSYLLALERVPTPATIASFDFRDAADELDRSQMPLVFKQGEGAGSRNVQLVRSRRKAARLLETAFCGQLFRETRLRSKSWLDTIVHAVGRRWFWNRLLCHQIGKEPAGYLYWQEFVPANEADLRITVIGCRHAYGFWRNNRPHDFRASGSGRIDFQRAVPEAPLRCCLDLNRRLQFDSMAYDILFKGDDFVINEISYGYVDSAPYQAAGHYELADDGTLSFIEGHVWPEALWVDWALERAAAAFPSD